MPREGIRQVTLRRDLHPRPKLGAGPFQSSGSSLGLRLHSHLALFFLALLLVDWGALVHRRCHSGCAWFAKDVCHHSDRRLLYNLAIHDELHHADRKGCIRGNLDFRDFGDAVTPQNIVTRTSMCQQNMQCAWHLYVRPLAQPTQIRHSLQSRSHPPQRVGAPSARKPV